ncbi:MAG: hypothetical protein IKQ15_07730, partial [Kiritimatiellae bacterium]|nr:hypothetical protein [Kiritimatiellia bacterium]
MNPRPVRSHAPSRPVLPQYGPSGSPLRQPAQPGAMKSTDSAGGWLHCVMNSHFASGACASTPSVTPLPRVASAAPPASSTA